MALLDVRYTGGKSRFLNSAARFLTRPFGSSEEVLRRRPWEAIAKYFFESGGHKSLSQLHLYRSWYQAQFFSLKS